MSGSKRVASCRLSLNERPWVWRALASVWRELIADQDAAERSLAVVLGFSADDQVRASTAAIRAPPNSRPMKKTQFRVPCNPEGAPAPRIGARR